MTHSTNALHLFNSKQEFPVAGVQAGKVALSAGGHEVTLQHKTRWLNTELMQRSKASLVAKAS